MNTTEPLVLVSNIHFNNYFLPKKNVYYFHSNRINHTERNVCQLFYYI